MSSRLLLKKEKLDGSLLHIVELRLMGQKMDRLLFPGQLLRHLRNSLRMKNNLLKFPTQNQFGPATCVGALVRLCAPAVLAKDGRNRSSEYVVDYDTVPEKIIRQVTGQVQYEEEGIRVQPIVNAPDEARQQLRIVPITTIRYNWKKSEGVFYLCGYENRVYAPNYPQSCCCCCHCGSRCSIL
ncbi:hypothetical protein C0J52_19198 [Blattella germanica]|nr:hypothetical protein C0J52_19198 [Blattella germanica]